MPKDENLSQAAALFLILLAGAPADDFRVLVDGAAADRRAGDLDGALDKLERAHRLRASPALLNNIGVLLQELGRYRAAAAVFRAVVADPKADRGVVERDRKRLTELEPKLERAWVVRKRNDRVGAVVVCGVPVSDREVAVPAGTCVVEAYAADGSSASVSTIALEVGRRHVVSPWLNPPVRSSKHGAVVLGMTKPQSIVVDGHALSRTLPSGRVWLNLAPGDHLVVVMSSAPKMYRAKVVAGGIAEMTPVVLDATAVRTAPMPAPPPTPAAEGSALPWILGGSGLAAGITAAVLFGVASGRHNRVYTAERDNTGAIVGLTQTEADDIERSARTLDAVALTTGITAAACLVSATVLALLDE